MNTFIIKRPVITEKSMLIAKTQSAYTFLVELLSTKAQVAEAVEEAFGVDVIKVNMTVLSAKRQRVGKARKMKTNEKRKKAVVTLKKGQKIPLFEVEG